MPYDNDASSNLPHGLSDETWETLVDAIVADECTPFLGAGVAVPHVPRGADLAATLAQRYEYPLDDVTNLARVTQFVVSRYAEPYWVKRKVCDEIKDAMAVADTALKGALPRNYTMLAALELPIYITTNYDNYLERAIAATGKASGRVEICRWSDRLMAELPEYSTDKPSPSHPLIFHLHGHMSKHRSILVTEDDYIDFTVSLAQRPNPPEPVIPHFVRRALGNTNLLFIGYSLEDWNFRVLMRHLMKQQHVQTHDRYSSVSIQLSSDKVPEEKRKRAEEFLEVYLRTTSSINVHWGDAGAFLESLQARVEVARSRRQAS